MSAPPSRLPQTSSKPEYPAPATAGDTSDEEEVLLALRRRVQQSELLAAATERLLRKMQFNGRLIVAVHKGRVFKSAYEEGYFRRKNDLEFG
ncbi:MAG: hypothetical protein ACXVZQ_07910 [Terriglobales bacterium]